MTRWPPERLSEQSDTRVTRAALLLCALALSACASFSPVQPGMTRDEVVARMAALPSGTRLQYTA